MQGSAASCEQYPSQWVYCNCSCVCSRISLSPTHPSGRKLEDTVFDRDVEKAFMKASEGAFRSKVAPALVVAKEVGNMYTASLYGGIVSLLAQ